MSRFAVVGRLFSGPNGLRAGVRLVLYLALFAGLFALNDVLRATVLARLNALVRIGIVETLAAVDLLLAHVTWLGGLNIAMGGGISCLMLRGTGNLWMAIGGHAAIDWTEAFVYGVPVSGTTVPGALLHSSLPGPVWLSGGPAGPEGSIVFTAAMLPVAWGVATWMRRREGARHAQPAAP